jgi:hypothetical protein
MAAGASYGYIVEENVITGNRFGLYVWNFGACPLPGPEIARFSRSRIEGNAEREMW